MRYVFLLLILPCLATHADTFYGSSKRGWFWFEPKDRPNEQEHQQTENPLQALAKFKVELETRKAAMIMHPSIENAKRYMEMQNEMFLKASVVRQNWQKALLLYPELNIVKNTPISEPDITRKLEEQKSTKELKDFAKEFDLLFFYKSNCPYCEKFADVVAYFSKQYGYKVLPIALDGKPLKGFKGIYNRNLIERLNIQSTPSLFAYSNKKGVILPIAHGFLSIDLLERNALTAKKLID